MAYSNFRFSRNAAGKTGFGRMAFYDGSGTDAEGGDTLGDVSASTGGFFPRTNGDGQNSDVRDAILQIVGDMGRGPHFGAGLVALLRGRHGQELHVLWDNGTDIRPRGTPLIIT